MKADSTGKIRVATAIKHAIEEKKLTTEQCEHLLEIQEVIPSSEGCEDCLKLGDRWVHLRVCLTCGYVGCCNDSKNKHAAKHSHATGHPMIASFEPGEDWIWCYVDEVGFTV